MSFKISKIVIYGHDGQVRILPFEMDRINIITGASKTGKSALIHIVSYCLGGDVSRVPGGVIVENVSWFAVLLQRKTEQLFVARKNPWPENNSTEDIYIEKGNNLDVPLYSAIIKNGNLAGLKSLLTDFAGITEYSFEPKEGQTRKAGSADITKALIYCFQEQSEVANQKALFHRQGEPYLFQNIKDYMPFFLGVVNKEYISNKDELRRKRSELRSLESVKAEYERMRGQSFKKPHGLIQEAVTVGLLPSSQEFPESWDDIKGILNNALKAQSKTDFSEESPEKILDDLFEKQKALKDERRIVAEEILALESMKGSEKGFLNEVVEQRARLISINLFEDVSEDIEQCACPFCESKLDIPTPLAEAVRNNLKQISKQLENVTADSPHVDSLIQDANKRKEEITSKLSGINARIESLQETNIRIQEIRDTNAKKSLIKGRIGLYLESMNGSSDNTFDETKIEEVKKRIEELEALTGDEEIQERIQSVLSNLSQEMTKMAKQLSLEYAEVPMRLDIKKLTVVADMEDGPLPLESMGSGANWVSLHLITYLVLQRWFAKKDIPVPRFVFFDQPTQVYFPPDREDDTVKNTDIEAVLNMFKLIKDYAEELGIQVVIMDHADIQQDWFQGRVIEKWWDGKKKLVPMEWINDNSD